MTSRLYNFTYYLSSFLSYITYRTVKLNRLSKFQNGSVIHIIREKRMHNIFHLFCIKTSFFPTCLAFLSFPTKYIFFTCSNLLKIFMKLITALHKQTIPLREKKCLNRIWFKSNLKLGSSTKIAINNNITIMFSFVRYITVLFFSSSENQIKRNQ